MKSNSAENSREKFWRAIPLVYLSMDNWPSVNEDSVREEDRDRFKRLCKATDFFLKKQPINEVLDIAQLGERQFFRLIKIALRRCKDGTEINGTRAFVKLKVQQKRDRWKPLSSGLTGFTGMFSKLFREYPEIETSLIEFLNGKERPNKVTPRILHEKMKLIAKAQPNNIQPGEYPLNTKSGAYYPLQKWYKEVYMSKHLLRHIGKEHGAAASTAAKYETGDGTSQTPPMPYSIWVIDEVRLDLETVVEIPNARWDVEYLELNCFQVIRCRSIGAVACNISWHLCLRKQASGTDVIQLFKNAVLGQPVAPVVDQNLTYKSGAGFPANIFPLLKYATPLVVYLDNALSHLFNDLQHLIQRLFGGRVILGKPADPKGRPNIESSFAHYMKELIHQYPSTTGVGPLDPVRKNSSVVPSKRIPVGLIENATDVYFADQNVLPSAGAGYLDSFTRLGRSVESGQIKLNYLAEVKRHPHHFSAPKPVEIKCDLSSGRLPHVNYMHRRYSSTWLKTQPALRGKRLWALADYDDLRMLVLVDDTGATFTTVVCEGQWGKVPHDLRMIQIYSKHKADARFGERPQDNPLFSVLSFLSNVAKNDRDSAMDLAYILRYLKIHIPAEEFMQIQDGEFNESAQQDAQDSSILVDAKTKALESKSLIIKQTLVPVSIVHVTGFQVPRRLL